MKFSPQYALNLMLYITATMLLYKCDALDITREDLSALISEAVSKAIKPLETDISDVKSSIRSLENGFVGIHNFGRDRVIVSQKVTSELKLEKALGCFGSLTRHAFIFMGYVGELMTPHGDCWNSTNEQLQERDHYIVTHPTKDFGIIRQCPSVGVVLDISVSTVPKLGDRVITYGFGDTASVWEGVVSRIQPLATDPVVTHWMGSNWERSVTSGEYLIQSAQHPGQSGAAVSNGCGYIGIVHATKPAQYNFGTFAMVIPAKYIQDFIIEMVSKNSKALMRYEECLSNETKKNLEIVEFPVFPFMNCDKIPDDFKNCSVVE